MLIHPVVFYSFAFTIAVLAFVLGVLVISYERILQKTHRLKKDYEALSLHLNERSARVFEEARKKALSIIEEANSKSGQIISSLKSFENKSDDDLKELTDSLSEEQRKVLEERSDDLIKSYQQALNELRQKNIDLFKNISKDIEGDAVSEIKDFRQILEKETFASQKVVSGKIEEEYKKIEEELQKYKAEKLKEVDDSIYKILIAVSKRVIGKSLSVEDHTELVIQALEKAKKENFFN